MEELDDIFLENLNIGSGTDVLQIGDGGEGFYEKFLPLCGSFTVCKFGEGDFIKEDFSAGVDGDARRYAAGDFLTTRFGANGIYDVIYSRHTFYSPGDRFVAVCKAASLLKHMGTFAVMIEKSEESPEDIAGFIKAARMKPEKVIDTHGVFIFIARRV